MPRDAVSRTANVGTVGTNGLKFCICVARTEIPFPGIHQVKVHRNFMQINAASLELLNRGRFRKFIGNAGKIGIFQRRSLCIIYTSKY